MTEYSPAKTGEYPRIFPSFQNCVLCQKDLKDNKDNSFHLGRKYARIFVLGHYLFLVAHSFPRASLPGNCSLLRTDNVRGQISGYIFAPNGNYCLYMGCIKRCTCLKLGVLQKTEHETTNSQACHAVSSGYWRKMSVSPLNEQ